MKLPLQAVTKIVLALNLAIFPAPSATSVEDGAVTVNVAIGSQKDSPLQILGIKRPERVGEPARVQLRNVSSNKTARFWVEVLIGTPNAGFISSNSNGPNEFWPQERLVEAGNSSEVKETVLQSNNLVMAAKQLHSRCLSVSVLVMSVDFADGTQWQLKPEEEKQIWMNMTWPQSPSVSQPTQSPDCRLEDLDGVGYRLSGPDSKQEESVSSYSFSCSLRRTAGKLMAMCPRW
jgi:hypothetical protein